MAVLNVNPTGYGFCNHQLLWIWAPHPTVAIYVDRGVNDMQIILLRSLRWALESRVSDHNSNSLSFAAHQESKQLHGA
jgi:hypothetical protein